MTPVIHPSANPVQRQQAALAALQRRKLPASFLYESDSQAAKWLKVHEKWSPARMDAGCLAIYDEAADRTARQNRHTNVTLIGLGCGGGLKDAAVARSLLASSATVKYLPVDISGELTLEAAGNSPAGKRQPVVIDLTQTPDAGVFIADHAGNNHRLVTLFGMLPNMDALTLSQILQQLLRSGDRLLCSANLAPGIDYDEGVRQVFPQYDNPETREWLMGGIGEIGIQPRSGELSITCDTAGVGLRRIVARFVFNQDITLNFATSKIFFQSGEALEVFFSIRHQFAMVEQWLTDIGLKVKSSWVTDSGEEAVFLCVCP